MSTRGRGGGPDRRIERARSKMARAEADVEQRFEQARERIDQAEERLAQQRGPVWARPEPGARRARFTREQIAEAALGVADAEGFDAVSMRRVATELGAGTMTLYHYVRTKDELVVLMTDAVMGELLVPDDELPSDWRAALTALAARSHASLMRHPWMFEAMDEAQIGPNSMRHMEQSVGAVAELDLDLATRWEIITMVDDYVFGYTLRSRLPGPADPDARADWRRRMSGYVDQQLATGEFPRLAAMLGERGMSAAFDEFERADAGEGRFERGLERLLDGIALDLERRGS